MKQIYLKFSMLLLCLVVGLSSVFGEVVSGTTYSTPKTSDMPTGWSAADAGGTSYIKLTSKNHYINTDNFTMQSISSIVVSARKYNGPTAAQAKITVSWYDASTNTATVLGTVDPTNTSLKDFTVSVSNSPSGTGYINIECKDASGTAGSGVGAVTINYTTSGGSTTTYTVTANSDLMSNGTVTADKSSAAVGETVTLTATPNNGYEVDSWYLTNEYGNDGKFSTTTISDTQISFTMKGFNMKYYATFKESTPATTVAAPTFDVPTGTYTETQLVLVSNYDNSLMYFYTVDGSTPDCDENLDATGTSKLYDNNEGITISTTTTLNMIAVDEDGNKSSITTATYTFKVPYTVTIVTPENGTLTVKNGESDVVSGSSYYAGDIISITATPNEGYKFRNVQVNDGTPHTYTSSNTKDWTMGDANITIKANFDAIENHTITWSVNGATSTTSVEDGAEITFPTDPADVYGKKFVGWVSSEIEGTTDTKPTFVNSAKASDDVTYYAVFANAEGGSSETATLSCTATAEKNKYEKTTATDDKGNTWNLYTNINKQDINNVSHFFFGLNSNNAGYNIASPTFPGSIISVKANVWNTSSSKTRYAYLCSSNETAQPTKGDLGEMTIATSTKNQQKAFELVEDAEFNQFYIYASKAGAIGFESIEVTYGTPTTYSAYCTTVPDYMAVTISEKCTDGTKYYSTFSVDQYFCVPADVTVSEVGLDENRNLRVVSYETGDIVEKGTGVMLSSTTPGVKYIELLGEYEPEIGNVATALGDDNCLWGTLDEGVSADDMEWDGYQFYRLTMHNGTQIGFWWGAENGGPFNLGKNKAYLVVPQSQEVKVQGMWFANDATSISAPAIENNANETIYNLNGQRINKATKGMYIKNGKKYFVK